MKNLAYVNIKNHEKQGFTFSLENTISEKPQEGQIDNPK